MHYCTVVNLKKELLFNKDVRYGARRARQQGIEIVEVPFSEFKNFYTSIVSVKKTNDEWVTLSKDRLAFMGKKGGVPVTAASFSPRGSQVSYSLAVSDFSSPYATYAAYLLQVEVIKELQRRGYEYYVLGKVATDHDTKKLRDVSKFKEQFGERYTVEGSEFPYRALIKSRQDNRSQNP